MITDNLLPCNAGNPQVRPGRLQWWQASCNLIVVIIGSGVMALPNLPNKGGVWLSVFFLLLCGVTVTQAGLIMVRAVTAANKDAMMPGRVKEQISSYEDFGRRARGNVGEFVVVVAVTLYQTGFLAQFTVLIAQSCQHLESQLLDLCLGQHSSCFTKEEWMKLMCPCFIGLAMMQNVTSVTPLSQVGVLALIVLFVIIVSKSLSDARRWQDWPDLPEAGFHQEWPHSITDCGFVAGTLFGAFGVVATVPVVLNEMEKPHEFPFALRMAMCAVGIVYFSVMTAGYYAYGSFMQPDIIESLTSFPRNATEAFDMDLSPEDWTGPKNSTIQVIASCLLLIKLIPAYPLHVLILMHSWQTLQYTADFVRPGGCGNKVLRVCIPIIATILATLVPNINQLAAIVSAFLASFLQVFFPLFFGRDILLSLGQYKPGILGQCFYLLMMVTASYAFVAGTSNALHDILN